MAMATANPLAVFSRLSEADVRAAIHAEMCARSLETFWKGAWDVHHPATELVWNWHIPAMCEHIVAADAGEIGDLVINVPPGMAKSLGVSVYYPAWKWIKAPHWQIIAVGAVSEVVLRDARRMHELCDSKWYRDTFIPQWDWNKSQDAKGYFANTAGGFRLSKTTGQMIIGIRGDVILIDDPLDASQAYADKAALEQTNQWLDQSLSTRKNRPTVPRILIMQRLHERDPSGHMLEQAGWTHLCLPNEYDGNKHKTWAGCGRLLHEDPREEIGELLFPAICDAEETQRRKDVLGRIGYAGQYQQDPLPADGVIFLEQWFQFWDPDELPAFDLLIGSWDLNDLTLNKRATKDTDYVVGQLWGAHGLDRYLIAQVREKLNQIQSGNMIAEQFEKWPKIHKILIEEAANGPDVIADLQTVVPRRVLEAVPVRGKGSKIKRAISCQRIVSDEEPGRVYLPPKNGRPWVATDKGNFMAEVCGFPNRRRDDQVDAMTQALNWLRTRKPGFFSARAGG